MKKLKLNKQTVSVLGTNEQAKVLGGGDVTGYAGCVNYTKNVTACYTGQSACICGTTNMNHLCDVLEN